MVASAEVDRALMPEALARTKSLVTSQGSHQIGHPCVEKPRCEQTLEDVPETEGKFDLFITIIQCQYPVLSSCISRGNSLPSVVLPCTLNPIGGFNFEFATQNLIETEIYTSPLPYGIGSTAAILIHHHFSPQYE